MSPPGRPSWPRPDFLGGGTRRPLLAWLWAATGLLVLASALTDTLVTRGALQSQQARLAHAEQRVERMRKALASEAPAEQGGGQAETEARRAARLTVDRLAHPWGRLLTDLEAESAPGLQWLLFDHEADSSDLRVEGLAPDAATALHLVDALASRRGWSDVVLGRLDAPDERAATGAGRLWHFELRATIAASVLAAAPAGR